MYQAPSLEDTFSQWLQWPVESPPRLIRIFSSGLNHKTFLIESASRPLVLKIFEQPNPGEISAQKWASEHKMAAKILYHDDACSYVLMEYLHSENFEHVRKGDSHLIALARNLKKLHAFDTANIEHAGSQFDVLEYCDQYLVKATAATLELHQTVLPALDAFCADDSKPCYCHNDLVPDNCLVNKAGARFIDWEYAQVNNPWYDIGSIISYLKLKPEEIRLFLQHYKDGLPTQPDHSIFFASQMTVLWLDMTWHLNKFGEAYWAKLKDKKEQLLALQSQFAKGSY